MESSGKFDQKDIVRELFTMVDKMHISKTAKERVMDGWIRQRQTQVHKR